MPLCRIDLEGRLARGRLLHVLGDWKDQIWIVGVNHLHLEV